MSDAPALPRWTDYVRLSDIRPAVRNAKLHAVEDLAASFTEFGSVESMAADERTGRLVAGHGRWASMVLARSRGDSPPDGVIVDEDGEWLVPMQRGWSSRDDAHAEAYVIASNRLQERGGGYDNRELAAMLEDLASDAPDLLDVVGYDAEDLEEFLRYARDGSDDPHRPDPDPAQDTDSDDDEVEGEGVEKLAAPAESRMVACPECGHHFQAGVN